MPQNLKKSENLGKGSLEKVGFGGVLNTDGLLRGMAKRIKDRYYFELNTHFFFATGDQ
jgi:hypothetical protein